MNAVAMEKFPTFLQFPRGGVRRELERVLRMAGMGPLAGRTLGSPLAKAQKRAAASFSPADIVWISAFAARLETYSNNDPVGTITGQFGTPDFTQTGDARATFKTNIQNGQPAYFFDGVDDGYHITGLSGTQPFTLMVVGFHLGNSDNLSNRPWLQGAFVTEGGIYAANESGGHWAVTGNFGGAQSTALPFTPSLVIAEFNGTSCTLEVNGTDYPISFDAGAWGLTELYIGYNWLGKSAYGYVLEGYAKGGLLSADEKTNMRAYLNAIYGLY